MDAIDLLILLDGIIPEYGEDITDDFVAWIDREATWVTTEMDVAIGLNPAVDEYVSAVIAARQKTIDGIYVLPSDEYEFNAEVETIIGLRDRIAAIAP